MLYEKFYSALGKLLYAVAAADGTVTADEEELVRGLVRKELAPAEKHTDEFGSNAAYYAELEFDYLESEGAGAEEAFEAFLDFIDKYYALFDAVMVTRCVRVADKLDAAYSRGSDEEKKLLGRIREEFDKRALLHAGLLH